VELAEEIAQLFEQHDVDLTVLPRRDGGATVRAREPSASTELAPSDRPAGSGSGLDPALAQGITILERSGYEVSTPRPGPAGLYEVVVRRTW
jgi:hypothetical protein